MGLVQAFDQALTADALRKSEAALAKERDLLTTLIDSIPEAFYYKDTQGAFLRINDRGAGLRAVRRRLDAR